jgi:hypothetical protein
VPAQGCRAYAAKMLYGSVRLDDFRLNVVADIQDLLGTRIVATPVVEAASKEWSRCLRRRFGASFTTPGAIRAWLTDEYRRRGSDRRLRRTEIRLAVETTKCRYDTPLATAYPRVAWSVVSAMPESWYRDIVRVQKADAKALRTARAILKRS